jgi:hypothetical protein
LFDGDLCVGVGIVDHNGPEYVSVKGSLDDPTTTRKDGFTEENPLTLLLWDNLNGKEIPVSNFNVEPGFTGTFTRNGTSVLKVAFAEVDETCLKDAYPNPSYQKTIFTFNLQMKSRVRLEIIGSSGEVVAILVDGELDAGMQTVEWNNTITNGQPAMPGVYFYRLKTDEHIFTKSLVIQY